MTNINAEKLLEYLEGLQVLYPHTIGRVMDRVKEQMKNDNRCTCDRCMGFTHIEEEEQE